MGNLFGIKRRAPVVTAQDRAILQLKQQRDKIKMYQKRTELDLIKNKDLALKLFQNGMKERALIVMRRKKNMEDILRRTDQQLETLESLVSDLEYTQIEISVVEGLKVGTDALKQLNSLMNIDDIQKMMEDNDEAAEKQKEITNILQQSSERYDEDDLLNELEAYKQPVQKTEEDQEIVVEEQKEIVPATIEEQKPERIKESPAKEQQKHETSAEIVSAIDSIIQELPDAPSELPPEEAKPEARPKKERQLELAE